MARPVPGAGLALVEPPAAYAEPRQLLLPRPGPSSAMRIRALRPSPPRVEAHCSASPLRSVLQQHADQLHEVVLVDVEGEPLLHVDEPVEPLAVLRRS